MKRTISILLALCLPLALIPLATFPVSAAVQQQPGSAVPQAQSIIETIDHARLDVDILDGIVTITNAEGKTIIYEWVDRWNNSYTGTMEIYDTDLFIGYDMTSTMSFYVPKSASFTFTSDMPGIGARVSDKVFTYARSDTAQTIVFKDHARVVEIQGEGNHNFRLFLIDHDEIRFDMVNVYGSANGNASLALNDDGSILLNGVIDGAEIAINNNPYFDIPSGHDPVLLTGSANRVEAYDADGTLIYLQLIEQPPQPLKWWQKLPAWVQWILRNVFFGWLWM